MSLLAGCALPMPLSESLVFGEEPPPHPGPAALVPARVELGVGWVYVPDARLRAERLRLDSLFADESVGAAWRLQAPHGFAWQHRDWLAVGWSVGSIIGMSADVTVRLPGRVFLTGQTSLLGHHGAYVQRPLVNSRGLGLSVGVVYRYEHFGFETFEWGAPQFAVRSVGGRALLYVRAEPVAVRGTLSLRRSQGTAGWAAGAGLVVSLTRPRHRARPPRF